MTHTPTHTKLDRAQRRPLTDSPPVVAALVLLLSMGVSLILAFSVVRRPGQFWSPFTIAHVHGAEAAAKPLPIDTSGWPPAREYTELYLLGRREIETSHATPQGPTTRAARVELYGWPMACLIESDRWGPDGDPVRLTSAPTHAPLNVRWLGLLVDTLVFALPVAMVLLVPLAIRKVIRRVRLSQGVCPACCYPVGPAPVCTERGALLEGARRLS